MKTTVETPDLSRQIKLSMASTTRIYIAAKTLFAPLLAIAIPVPIVFLVNNQAIKTYSLIGGGGLFLAFILFYIFCPKIISKKFQLKKYIAELSGQTDVWEKRIKDYKDRINIIVNQDALSISPFPEISKGMQKVFSESVKLMQNINENFETSTRQVVEQYNNLCLQYVATGEESPLYKSLKTVTETLKKSHNERFAAATAFFESCKVEQKNLPIRAGAYKAKLIDMRLAEIARCEKEIDRIKDKKNQAALMLESL